MASDQMGRFSFDGAENYAFWVSEQDPELEHNTPVLFSELDTLKEFLGHNFPGLMSGITEVQINRLAQYLYEEGGTKIEAMTDKPKLVAALTAALKRADVSIVEEVQVTTSPAPVLNPVPNGDWLQRRFLGIS